MNRIKDIFELLDAVGILDDLADFFSVVNNPKHQKNSLEELVSYAREEKGIKVEFVPFPDGLLGDANEIGKLKYILLNQFKSRLSQDFTMRHDLAHHEFGHFRKNQPEDISELQAHMFAAFHFWQNKRQHMKKSDFDEYIRENPEAFIYPLTVALFFSGAIATGLVWQAIDWISSIFTKD